MKLKAWMIICILFALLLFSVQNYYPVRITFLFWAFETNTLILISALFLSGFIAGFVSGFRSMTKDVRNERKIPAGNA